MSLSLRTLLLLGTSAATITAQGTHASAAAAAAAGPSSSSAAHSGSTSGSQAGGQHGAGHNEPPGPADFINIDVQHHLGWLWVALCGSFLIYHAIVRSVHYIRKIACLNNETQRYFANPNVAYGRFKRHFSEAPLFRTRHHREFKLSSALNVGTLPSRFQTLLICAYFGVNVAFCVYNIDYANDSKTVLKELRNRTGVLSVINMVPLFLFAHRNNPLINFCGVSFDTFNLMHRWLGRISVLEAIAHTCCYCINKVNTMGWAGLQKSLTTHLSTPQTGLIATCAFVAILFTSPSIVRHAFYEAFLHFHIAMAALALAILWLHLKDLESQKVLIIVIAFWLTERSIRICHIVYRNFGSSSTKADVEVLPGDALRVTLRMARPWKFRPGQHVYLYIPHIGWWTSHPFSLAWSDSEAHSPVVSSEDLPVDIEKSGAITPVVQHDVLGLPTKTSMSLIIRRRTGFTEKLYRKAQNAASGRFTTTAIVEGPYGKENLHSYGTVLLFAAGVGITHQVPHVRDLVVSFSNSTSATRKVVLVWIIQSPEHLEWIRPWMTTILSLPQRRDVLKILLFVTRPRSTKEIHSPSSSVQMFPGKPNVTALVEAEADAQVGAMAVSVCGTGSLADDVRKATRGVMSRRNVDFVENAFSW
ncbi:ferric reductase [Patellaria atrata CBS 101060]|uniref:ferric-chelate reductase (NADPH) n=1 Tax=Patellaria atrata CBS 101060 TaxID=1346257 RepID=A0A9P4S1K8_9PEZI|nr:ferric reductase [Patellaria atrata CBS 101060]